MNGSRALLCGLTLARCFNIRQHLSIPHALGRTRFRWGGGGGRGRDVGAPAILFSPVAIGIDPVLLHPDRGIDPMEFRCPATGDSETFCSRAHPRDALGGIPFSPPSHRGGPDVH